MNRYFPEFVFKSITQKHQALVMTCTWYTRSDCLLYSRRPIFQTPKIRTCFMRMPLAPWTQCITTSEIFDTFLPILRFFGRHYCQHGRRETLFWWARLRQHCTTLNDDCTTLIHEGLAVSDDESDSINAGTCGNIVGLQ